MSIKDIVNEPTFKKGDWILIKKPKGVCQRPVWIHHMDKYDGQTLEIEEINSYGYLIIDDWCFNPDWCTKVEAPKPKVGDRCIFWDGYKSDAMIGKLTAINYESDFLYYKAGSTEVFENCILFQSMEQYNEFINE